MSDAPDVDLRVLKVQFAFVSIVLDSYKVHLTMP